MKNLGLFLIVSLFAGLAIVSCADSDENGETKDTLTVSPGTKAVTFSASGTKLYADEQQIDPVFRVTTTAPEWDAEVVSSWCSIVDKDPEKGTFKLQALPCTSETQAPEVAVVMIRSGSAAPVEITVSQQVLSLDIYVAGVVYYEPMIRTAVYWKNGEVFPLVEQGIDSYVKQIQLVGDDLYVSGGFEDATEGWTTGYWKNGVFHALPKERKPEIYEFHVTDAGDVYAVGYDKLKAVYWKNDEMFRMETSTSYAYGMWLDGEDLYAVGTRYVSGTGMVGAYWKNGALVSEFGNISFHSICVADGKVYMLGMEKTGSEEEGTEKEVPFYMIDAQKHVLSEADGCSVNKIRVLDGKVVCTGTGYYFEERLPDNVDIEYYYPQYWVDGAVTELAANDGEACGVTSCNGNIYIAGEDFDPIQVVRRAVYWKDGKRIALDDTLEATACDMLVVAKEE